MSTPLTSDVVVLLPGITGSVLAKDGRAVWSPAPGAVMRGLLSLGRSLKTLEVVDDDPRAEDLGDGVTAPGLVGAAHLIPGLMKIDVYSELEAFLLSGIGLTRGENYFPFPYDWRRDNRASARRLQRQAHGWLRDWRERSGVADAKLVLVGHSMGGLVARYFVEALEGWRDTRAVITYGTPFYGSLNAVDFLVNGFRKGLGPFRTDLSPLLRSLTSVHQLVPAYRCVHAGDAAAVTPANAGLPGWQAAWSDHLLDFQREVEDAAESNRRSGPQPFPVTYHPIVGRDQPTRQSARVSGTGVEMLFARGDQDDSGDGTVPFVSAAVSGTEQSRTFIPDRHARLQGSIPMQTHLKGLLAATQSPRIQDLRDQVTLWFGLDVDDVFLPGEPVSLDVHPLSLLDRGTLPDVELTVSVRDEATGAEVLRRDVRVPREPTPVELGPLPSSSYVVTLTGGGSASPASDVFAVASPEDVDGLAVGG
jgi:pimeloyl-ACP methyl ester carboxylesterase